MSLVLLEDLLAAQVALMPEIQINGQVTREPSFGWGSADDLRKFLAVKGVKHNPLIWLVPSETDELDLGVARYFEREIDLNFCVVAGDVNELNEIRLEPNASYKKVLMPMWEALERRIRVSTMSMVEEVPKFQLIPNYKVDGDNQGQYVWDVLRLSFTMRFVAALKDVVKS